MSLTNSLLGQMFAQNSDDPFLTLFTLEHSDWPTPIYMVNNTESITSNGNVFESFPVMVTLPADDGETVRSSKITFDNVSRELIDSVRATTDNSISVTLQMVLASDPDNIEIELGEMKIVSVQYNAKTVTATLTLDDFLNTQMTSEQYTPSTYPGLF